MTLVCGALRAALRSRMAAVETSKVIHVPLNKVGEVEFPDECPKEGYSDYMIRPSDSFLFCCKPSKRRDRLQRQITLLKTLWHVASGLKARRFARIIENQISLPSA